MHRIDTAGSINGAFDEGNPAIGQRATRVGAVWLNDLQENIMAVLLEGAIAPVKGRATDLRDAIKAIATGILGTGGGGGGVAGVPTNRRIDTAGLLTGGGDLSADRTFTVPKASAAEVQGGVEDAKAVTPLAMRGALAGIAGGEVSIFGAVIFKAGRVDGAYSEGAVYTGFATAFPNGCIAVVSTAINTTGSGVRDIWTQVISFGPAGFTTQFQYGGGQGNNIDGFTWIAIGY